MKIYASHLERVNFFRIVEKQGALTYADIKYFSGLADQPNSFKLPFDLSNVPQSNILFYSGAISKIFFSGNLALKDIYT